MGVPLAMSRLQVVNNNGTVTTLTSNTIEVGTTMAYVVAAPTSTSTAAASTSTSMATRDLEDSAAGRLMVRGLQWIGLLEDPDSDESEDGDEFEGDDVGLWLRLAKRGLGTFDVLADYLDI